MRAARATAPGKIILFGEHAVVYGRPAIAAPLSQVRAQAVVRAEQDGGVRLVAPDLDQVRVLDMADAQDAFALTVRLVRDAAGLQTLPPMTIVVSSDIPIASGLGSGAALTAAVIRALADFLGLEEIATESLTSDLTYEVEKIHHGTPSGIDNTVVAYERPVYFVRRQPDNLIETFVVRRPLHILVGDTGISSSTKEVVGDVRRSWERDAESFNRLFDACGATSDAARAAIESGDLDQVGRLMNENHVLLVNMTVSSSELNRLVKAAVSAGALGAKMSGGGRGGNMIALVTDQSKEVISAALYAAGARQVLQSVVPSTGGSG